MTPLSLIYLIVGIVSLVWPLALLFFRRKVLDAQWMMMTALMLFGLSAIIYSTFFNNFLKGEYLLVIIYMVVSLSVLPVVHAAMAVFTNLKGATYSSRVLVIPSLVTVLLMGLSVAVGGADMYRLWIERGTESIADHFFAGSWRYNLIVAVHYYLYWLVLVGEALYVAVYVVIALRRFGRTLNEFYATGLHDIRNIRAIYLTVGINCLCVLVNYVFFPFNTPRPFDVVAAVCLVQAADLFLLGWYFYHLNFGAEKLGEKMRGNRYGRSNLAVLGRNIIQYVEREKAYLDPDLSVFTISERYKVSQDDVVDAVHRLHGTSFGDYIDSLRVEHALGLLAAETYHPDDADEMSRLAHACGWLDADAFRRSFAKTVQMSVEEWVAQ